ncbi:MAG: heparinase II/III family protein [Draconibacterium sp.]|nr:heparinase II/III family protein [Draconibacterium sp.]
MKKLFLFFIFCGALFINGKSQGIIRPDSVQSVLKNSLISQSIYRPFPKIEDREGWKLANQELLQKNLKDADKLLDYKWETIPATYALLPSQTGNRGPYESILNRKKSNLWKLTLAEVYENKGRFLNQIIDGIWSICEDSYWGHTVHLNLWRDGRTGLPDVNDPFVDIYAAEMASAVAWVSYFLEEKLDSISPLINQRVYHEMNERIFEPTMKHHHYWMGASIFERRPNNWNPWICANWLNCVLLLEKDEERRIKIVSRIIEILDEFFIPFPNDGCSDEGPNYWTGAAGTFFEAMMILDGATNGAIDIVSNEKFKNMGRYIWRVPINETFAVNFSDAKPTLKANGSLIYNYGQKINDPGMIQMGAYYLQEQGLSINSGHLFLELTELFLNDEYTNIEGQLPYPEEYFFSETEVVVARDKEGSTKGFFVAAKGGNNHESHNHNDLGNYIIYYDAKPVIIDVGSGTYTARTFSPHRYDIWFNNSNYHNTPTINGVDQVKGLEYTADDVSFSSGQKITFKMNLVNAYPENSGIKSWERAIVFRKGKYVELSNRYELSELKGETCENIMTALYPKQIAKNRIGLFKNENDTEAFFAIEFDGSKFIPEIEKVELDQPEDKSVRGSWGDNIYRIRLKVKGESEKGDYKIRFRKL